MSHIGYVDLGMLRVNMTCCKLGTNGTTNNRSINVLVRYGTWVPNWLSAVREMCTPYLYTYVCTPQKPQKRRGTRDCRIWNGA